MIYSEALKEMNMVSLYYVLRTYCAHPPSQKDVILFSSMSPTISSLTSTCTKKVLVFMIHTTCY